MFGGIDGGQGPSHKSLVPGLLGQVHKPLLPLLYFFEQDEIRVLDRIGARLAESLCRSAEAAVLPGPYEPA